MKKVIVPILMLLVFFLRGSSAFAAADLYFECYLDKVLTPGVALAGTKFFQGIPEVSKGAGYGRSTDVEVYGNTNPSMSQLKLGSMNFFSSGQWTGNYFVTDAIFEVNNTDDLYTIFVSAPRLENQWIGLSMDPRSMEIFPGWVSGFATIDDTKIATLICNAKVSLLPSGTFSRK